MNPCKTILEYYIKNIKHRGKRHFVRWVLKVIPWQFIASYYGPTLCANPKDKTNIYAISGEYGHVISNHISQMNENSSFIDIGTNYGLYSLLAAQRLKSGQVYSFEPNPVIYPYFLRAVRYNKIKNIIPFNCAIGTEDSLLKLDFDENHSGISCLVDEANAASKKDFFNVPVFNISKWSVLNGQLISQKEIHIKIDVEGYELSIIKVLQQAEWYKNIKSLIIEIDDENMQTFGATAQHLYTTLAKDGFTPKYGLNTSQHYDEIFVKSITG